MKLRSKSMSSSKCELRTTRSKKTLLSDQNVSCLSSKTMAKEPKRKRMPLEKSPCIETEIESKTDQGSKSQAAGFFFENNQSESVKNSLPRRSGRSRSKRTEVKVTAPKSEMVNKKEHRLIKKIEIKRSGGYRMGDVVLVKWPYYPYWPAKIKNITKTKTVSVEFFGDYERTALVTEAQLYDFANNASYIINTLKSKRWKSYGDAISEAESHNGVPSEASLVNNLNDLC